MNRLTLFSDERSESLCRLVASVRQQRGREQFVARDERRPAGLHVQGRPRGASRAPDGQQRLQQGLSGVRLLQGRRLESQPEPWSLVAAHPLPQGSQQDRL